jgi:predicted permease
MRSLRRLSARVKNFARNRQSAQRLREEMEEHLTLQTEENIRTGMAPDEARRQALLKFGAVGTVAEDYHAEQGLPFFENLLQDLRYALRQLKRSPGYAVVAILTLALGIGANTAIFLLTWSILLKGLPVPHPEQLIRYTFRKGESETGLSYPLYQAIEKRQGIASGLFAWASNETTLRRGDQTTKVPIALATGSLFDVLQLHTSLGRGFDRQAGEPGAAYQPEALLSYNYWQTEFHADPSVIGQNLNLENNSVTIIGVLPPGFDGVSPDQRIDILLPLSFERVLDPKHAMMDSGGAFWLTVMGRLRSGETVDRAQANLAAIRKQVNESADPSHAFLNGGFFSAYQLGVEAGRSGRSWLRWKYAKPLMALEALCGLMMLLCSVNVALLIVSRVSGRLHEFAMRSALGASRSRLLAQVLTETLLLGVCGLGCGALLGWQLASVLVGMISRPGSPVALQLHAGVVVFLFTAIISMAAALLAGLWPAWRASHTAPAADLKQTSSNRSARRLGRWIIPTQVALGVVLLNAALLLTSTLLSYLRESSGFAAGNTVLAELDLGDSGIPANDQPTKALEYLHQVESAPGVQSAALMSMAPLSDGFSGGGYYTHDPQGNLHVNEQIWPESISRNYFSVMGTRILQGRPFNAADASGDRVCILSAAAAAYFFPGKSAIGELLNAGDGTEKPNERESFRVIGIADEAHITSLLETAPLMAYFPIERQKAGEAFDYSAIGVRATTSQIATDAIRRSHKLVFPGGPPPRTWLFRDAIAYDLSGQRLLSSVSGGFALLALTLVATGLYGILARTVTERRREIGIRMALGARRQQIITSLAGTAAFRVAIGVVAGAVLAAIVGRLLQSLLHGITPLSPWMALATFAVLLAVLALAFIFPARRAASVHPMEAIRQE